MNPEAYTRFTSHQQAGCSKSCISLSKRIGKQNHRIGHAPISHLRAINQYHRNNVHGQLIQTAIGSNSSSIDIQNSDDEQPAAMGIAHVHPDDKYCLQRTMVGKEMEWNFFPSETPYYWLISWSHIIPLIRICFQALVETAMLAAVSGLAYLVATILKIENTVG